MSGPRLPDLSHAEEDIEAGAEPTAMVDLSAMVSSRRQTPCLIVTSGDSALGLIFRLRGDMVIGRTVGCDILLAEADVSRRHATVSVHADGRVEVVDIGSSNGLLYQGRRVQRAFVEEGAKIGIGRATLVMLRMDDVDALLQKNHRVAARDPRSGLLSRRYFLEVLGWELGQREKNDGVLTVTSFVIDDFAAKRDARGDAAAEGLVQRVAGIVAETFQDPEIAIGRTAEDEISVIVRAESLASATASAEWIRGRSAVAAPITLSAGVAAASGARDERPAAVFAAAQRALLVARAGGGGRVQTAPAV